MTNDDNNNTNSKNRLLLDKNTLFASIITSIIIFPLESTLRKKQATNKHLITIMKKTSLKSAYNGLNVELLCCPTFWTMYFSIHNNIKHHQYTNYNMLNNMANVYISSFLASITANPAFTLKTKMQVCSDKTLINTSKEMYKNEGIRGFYRGVASSQINNLKLCIKMPLYYYMYDKHNINVLYSSFIAKLLANTTFYPFDLIRTIQRTSENNPNIITVSKNIYKNTGIKGFFRGYYMYNCVSMPAFILLMSIKELITKYTK